jgi:hypothetical protein
MGEAVAKALPLWSRRKGEQVMARNERRTPRKPATKFPNLRKKLQKGKTRSRPAKRK